MPALSTRPFHVVSADLRGADRAHRKSSGVLAELLHQWEVVNVVDENLAQGEGGLRWPSVVDGKGNLARAYGPGGPVLLELPVELPGIETGTESSLNCGNTESEYAKARETTWRDLRIRRRC